MERFLRCIDDVVLAVISTPGKPLRIEERPVTVVGRMISLTSAEVRACFDMTVPQIVRARAVAQALDPETGNPDALEALAGVEGGENRTDGAQYKSILRLLEIGQRITDDATIKWFAEQKLTLDILHFVSQEKELQVMRAWKRWADNALKPRKRRPSPGQTR